MRPLLLLLVTTLSTHTDNGCTVPCLAVLHTRFDFTGITYTCLHTRVLMQVGSWTGREEAEARTHAIIQRWRKVLLLSEAEVGWAVEEEREEEVERLLLLAGDRSRRTALD